MTDSQRPRPHDEEVAEPEARQGVRSDTGASGSRPKEESVVPASPSDEPEKGPRGSGEEPGYGHLGTSTPGEVGAPEGSGH
jgi:hypothetical protein